MTNFEREVLREIATPGSWEGPYWGAAMFAALEWLQGAGYVTRGMHPKITAEGEAALKEEPTDE